MNKTGKSGMIIALSIAMLGATIVVTYGALRVEAAPVWCYEVFGGNKCVADPPTQRNLIANKHPK